MVCIIRNVVVFQIIFGLIGQVVNMELVQVKMTWTWHRLDLKTSRRPNIQVEPNVLIVFKTYFNLKFKHDWKSCIEVWRSLLHTNDSSGWILHKLWSYVSI